METAEARRQKVLDKLKEWNIGYVMHEHPPLPTIEEAMKYWKNFDSTHCKNLFFRNHKGNRHYLVILECHKRISTAWNTSCTKENSPSPPSSGWNAAWEPCRVRYRCSA